MATSNIILQTTIEFFRDYSSNLKIIQAADTDTHSIYNYKELTYQNILKECKNEGKNYIDYFNESIFLFNFKKLSKQASFLLIPLCEIKVEAHEFLTIETVLNNAAIEKINKVEIIKRKPREKFGGTNPVHFQSQMDGFSDVTDLIETVTLNGDSQDFKNIFKNCVKFYIKKVEKRFFLYALIEFETNFSTSFGHFLSSLFGLAYFYTMEKHEDTFKIFKNRSLFGRWNFNSEIKSEINSIEIKFSKKFAQKKFRVSDSETYEFLLGFHDDFEDSNFIVKMLFEKDGIKIENTFEGLGSFSAEKNVFELKPETSKDLHTFQMNKLKEKISFQNTHVNYVLRSVDEIFKKVSTYKKLFEQNSSEKNLQSIESLYENLQSAKDKENKTIRVDLGNIKESVENGKSFLFLFRYLEKKFQEELKNVKGHEEYLETLKSNLAEILKIKSKLEASWGKEKISSSEIRSISEKIEIDLKELQTNTQKSKTNITEIQNDINSALAKTDSKILMILQFSQEASEFLKSQKKY